MKMGHIDYPGQNYIHWHLGHPKFGNTESYTQKYAQIANEIASKKIDLGKSFKKRVQKLHNLTNKNTVELLEFASLTKDENFKQALAAVSKDLGNISTKEYGLSQRKGSMWTVADSDSSAIELKKNQIISITEEFSSFLQALEQEFLRMEAFFATDGLDTYYNYLMHPQGSNTGKTEIAKFLKNTNKSNIKGTLTKDRMKFLNDAHKQLFANLQARIGNSRSRGFMKEAIQSQLNTIITTKDGTVRNKTFNEVMQSILTPIYVLRGLVNEIMVTEVLSIANVKGMLDKAIAVPSLGAQSSLRFIPSGTQQSSNSTSFSYATSDVQVSVDFKNKRGKAQVSIPVGISLKLSSSSNDDKIDIKVKDSSFGKLLKIVTLTGIIEQNEEDIYNILANANKKKKTSDKENYSLKIPNVTRMVHNLYYSFLIPSLAGNLNKDDLAMLLIVNNNIYSIYDILKNEKLMEQTLPSLKQYKNGSLKSLVRFQRQHKFLKSPHGYYYSREMGKKRTEALIGPGGAAYRWRIEMNLRGKLH